MTKVKIPIKTPTLVFWILSLTISMFLLNTNILPVEVRNILVYTYIISILFVPGLLIYYILRSHSEDFVTTALFSLGLSIFFITFTLILANIAFHTFNEALFTRFKLLMIFLISFSLLSFITVKKIEKITFTMEFSNISLFLGLLLFIVTLVSTLVLKTTNFMLFGVFFSFLILPFLIRFASDNSYPFLIWIFSLSLVFNNSFFGIYPRPTDNVYEIFTINEFVLKNGIWEQIAPNNILAMPNIMLFVPFLSTFTGSLVEVYKYIIPFIASFIPLGVYKISESKYDSITAFYSSYFFSSLFIYFTWCSITAKMVFAGLFLALLGIILARGIKSNSEKILLIVFSISLIFSHYGTSAIFAIGMILSIPLIPLLIKRNTELFNFGLLYFILYITYSILAAKGSIFNSVTLTISNTIRGINEILTPRNYGSELLLASVPPYLQILKILYIFAFIFALIEAAYILLRNRKSIDEFFIISVVLLTFIPIPYVLPVGQYAGGRAWFISGIFISSLVVAGLNRLSELFRFLNHRTLVVLFVATFFFFNSGLAAETIWKHNVGASVYLSYPRIVECGGIWEKEYLDRVTLDINDINSALWLKSNIKRDNTDIYIGTNSILNLVFVGFSRKDVKNVMGSMPYLKVLTGKEKDMDKNSYIYLNKFNVENKVIKVGGRIRPELISIETLKQTELSKIYTNGGSEIYYR